MSDVKTQMSDEELQDLVASTDTGARNPAGSVGKLLAGVALAWSLYQLWIASPLPFVFGRIIPVLNLDEQKAIHLAFAIFLTYTAYPALKRSPRDRIPIQDWVLALVAAFCGAYLWLFADALVTRPGLPTTMDLTVAGVGLVLLLEATRRALGPALMLVAIVFLLYVFFGNGAWVPELIQWKGASYQKAMNHMWLTTEGVFGVALGVSASFVFLFVLFGALLDKAGAGNYFIKVAFASLGHLRGGPAKAAVLSSAMTGLISGSSIANVVTTGTFTIPLMKRVGFTPEKAGSVEVASSVNGQIMPPVMGAAAFLMIEFVGISYFEVIKHAFLPAVISYIALIYIVHLEALKLKMEGLPKPGAAKTLLQRVTGFLIGFGVTAALVAIVFYGIGFLKSGLGSASAVVVAILVFVVYATLIKYASALPDLEMDDPNSPVVKLPELGPTAKTGLHYVLPIVVLVWFLLVERKSPGLSAFWATVLMIGIILTQKPLKAVFRGSGNLGAEFKSGWQDLIDGLISGARNMIGIGVAVSAAGIIVGAVSLTGIGQVMAEIVESLSFGILLLALVLTALISLILGMGLPTTANYIVVSSLMAPVLAQIAEQNGLIVPLIAVHLFVFYFGIMADVTPPVGLASFAAAAVSGGDPLKTGFTAFFYSLRTVALPFLFIFNTNLLLIDVGWFDGIVTFIIATVAMLIFAASTQGFFIVRSRIWESVALLLVALTLFRPGFWLDRIQSPFEIIEPASIVEVAAGLPADAPLRMVVRGENPQTLNMQTKTVVLPLGPVADGETRLYDNAGIAVLFDGDRAVIDEVAFGGAAEAAGLDFDFEILAVEVPRDRLPKEVFYIPALVVFGFIVLLQRRRETAELAAA